jgi:hypothetical protein
MTRTEVGTWWSGRTGGKHCLLRNEMSSSGIALSSGERVVVMHGAYRENVGLGKMDEHGVRWD